MDMMRMGSDGKNLVCRVCIERKPASKIEQKIQHETQAQKPQSGNKEELKEYFCKECKYSFTRAKHLAISTCPYCGNSGTLMAKGSTAKIIADASKMKDTGW